MGDIYKTPGLIGELGWWVDLPCGLIRDYGSGIHVRDVMGTSYPTSSGAVATVIVAHLCSFCSSCYVTVIQIGA